MDNNTLIPDLSVIVLCYKTGFFAYKFTENIISMLEKENIDYELILVGNYYPDSNDITPNIVKDLAAKYKKVIAITKPKEGKMGWDMRSGFNAAKGRHTLVIDGDGQMPYEDILRVYRVIKSGNFDLCKTYRIKRYDSLYRRCISVAYNIVFSVVFMTHARDTNSKPKIITREAYNKLKLVSDDWFIDAEIMIQAKRLKFKIGEIPTVFEQSAGRSSFVKFTAIFEFIKNIILFRINEFLHR
jgi:glycosyltransferase involved in cell wall biosynthesis